jgi:branched-chain amino acid transport system permease protein
MFGGFAGAFFAARQGFISPESFTFIESALILAIVVLGGMGSQVGVVLAGGHPADRRPELFREFAEYRMLVFGLAMVLVMIWRGAGCRIARLAAQKRTEPPPWRATDDERPP